MTACESTLEETIYSELTPDNAFQTEQDALAAVNGIYTPMIGLTETAIFYLNDMPTDACYKSGHDMEILNEDKWNMNGDLKRTWEGYYQIASRANIVLQNVPKIDMGSDPEKVELKNRFLGEAYFMRGFAYYQLSDTFFKVPLVTTVIEDQQQKGHLAEIETIEEQIISDLKTVVDNKMLPETYASRNDANRPTIGAAMGMLVRIYMRQAGRTRLAGGDASKLWEAAKTYTDKIFALADKGVYSLQPNVWDVFDPTREECKYNNELIFTVHSRAQNNPGSSGIGMNFTPWSYDMGWDLCNLPISLLWAMDKDDERYTKLMVTDHPDVYNNSNKKKKTFFVFPWSMEELGVLSKTEEDKEPVIVTNELSSGFTQKYKYTMTGSYNYATGNNMPLLRYADILLCRAEIENELNHPQQAVEYVNRIRQRAFGSKYTDEKALTHSGKSQDELRRAICHERLLELNNEGVRRPDLIRMGYWKETLDNYIAGRKARAERKEQNVKAQNPGTTPNFDHEYITYPTDLQENDRRRYYPIPKSETDLNPEYLNNRVF